MNEEIVARFGADTGPMDKALRGMKSSVGEAAEHGHKSFVHASNGAKQFHKVMHEITAQAPLLGGALQLAISPVAGIFVLAGMAIGALEEKFKEAKVAADKFSEWAAKPSGGDFKENAREAKKSVEELRREYEKWIKAQEQSPAHATTEGLNERLATLNAKSKQMQEADPTNAAQIEKNRLQLQFKLQSEALAKISEMKKKNADEVSTYEHAAETKAGETRIKRAKELIDTEKELQENAREKLRKKRDETESNTDVALAALRNMVGFGPGPEELAKEQMDEIAGLEASIKNSKKRIEENQDAIDKETKQHEAVTDKLKELQAKQTELKSTFDGLSHALEATRLSLSQIPGAPKDRRNAPTKASDEGVTALQKKISDALAESNQKITDWNVSHGLTPPQGFKDALGVQHAAVTGNKDVPTLLKDIDTNMEALLRLAAGKGITINNP